MEVSLRLEIRSGLIEECTFVVASLLFYTVCGNPSKYLRLNIKMFVSCNCTR